MGLLWVNAVAEQIDWRKRRLDDLFGSNDMDKLFQGHPQTPPPFEQAGRTKKQPRYYAVDPENPDDNPVKRALTKLSETPKEDRHKLLESFDPRELRSTQPWITSSAMRFYMKDEDKEKGETAADQNNIGNKYPFVYKRSDGQNIILSGHHRATRALLRGEPLMALTAEGD